MGAFNGAVCGVIVGGGAIQLSLQGDAEAAMELA